MWHRGGQHWTAHLQRVGVGPVGDLHVVHQHHHRPRPDLPHLPDRPEPLQRDHRREGHVRGVLDSAAVAQCGKAVLRAHVAAGPIEQAGRAVLVLALVRGQGAGAPPRRGASVEIAENVGGFGASIRTAPLHAVLLGAEPVSIVPSEVGPHQLRRGPGARRPGRPGQDTGRTGKKQGLEDDAPEEVQEEGHVAS